MFRSGNCAPSKQNTGSTQSPNAAACAGLLCTGAMSDAIKIMNAMIVVRSSARGANSLQDMIVLPLLATRLSVQDSATAGVPVLAWVTHGSGTGGALWPPSGSWCYA
jgi:hypothetical protein